MLYITHAPGEAALAARLKAELTAGGYTVNAALTNQPRHLLIALLSPEAVANTAVQNDIFAALDNGQHIIPVLAKDVDVPKLIDHLPAVDFRKTEDFATLKAQIDKLSAPDAGSPVRVQTPKLRSRNRRVGFWVLLVAVVWFIIGVVLVGVYGIQLPREEYELVDTQAAIEINEIVGRNLPRSTEDAANFPATLRAAPTAQRPLLIATTTAMAAEGS